MINPITAIIFLSYFGVKLFERLKAQESKPETAAEQKRREIEYYDRGGYRPVPQRTQPRKQKPGFWDRELDG